MIDPHRTGAVIARLRRARDWTQVQLAEQLHVTHQAVSRWETGESFPDLAVLHGLGQLFEVAVDDLLDRSPPADGGGRAGGSAGRVLDGLAQGGTERVREMVRAGEA